MSIIELTINQTAPTPSIWTNVIPGLIVAIGAGVVLWGLNWFREHVTHKLRRKAEAEVLAFSLASDLDQLIAKCSEVVNDAKYEDPETGEVESTAETPTFVLGDNLPWTSFPTKLQYRIRAIPNKIDIARKACGVEAEYGDGPPDYSDYFRERELQFSRIGLEAIEIRSELSSRYEVDYLERGLWDPKDEFETKIANINDFKEKQRNRPRNNWFLKKTPIEELEKRRMALAVGLTAAQANFGKS